MKVRAIPAQQKPFPTLADAAKTQSVFTFSESSGTIVGIYTPVFFKGLNVAGYHLHFISDDRKTGGHILDLTDTGKHHRRVRYHAGIYHGSANQRRVYRRRSFAGPERGILQRSNNNPSFHKESFFAIETYRIGAVPTGATGEYAMKIHGIKKDILTLLLRMAEDSHPNEFVALLREREGFIDEVNMLPGTIVREDSASLFFDMMPLDTHVAGSAHSHPSGPIYPSDADLGFSPDGKYHLIIRIPVRGERLALFHCGRKAP